MANLASVMPDLFLLGWLAPFSLTATSLNSRDMLRKECGIATLHLLSHKESHYYYCRLHGNLATERERELAKRGPRIKLSRLVIHPHTTAERYAYHLFARKS